ncbi:hypothetical protein SLS58_009408 [Diplodia intermedia]|uniref:Heterokaryon incompatibility domain-containing protein n=1 Tax=Diplodia intermedia TaxID=856260 RepID=A0ABR3TCB4_9PEZI
MGIRYLWIDSLCIQQDSRDDWSRESQTMHLVYSNSWCNLAATGAKDSSVGLFLDRDPSLVLPFQAGVWAWEDESISKPHTIFRTDTWNTYVYNSVLEQRGWVLQERTLSPRQLHFTKAGVFWECQCLNATEYHPAGLPEVYTDEHLRFYKTFTGRLEAFQSSRARIADERRSEEMSWIHDSWCAIVESYSRAKLTKSEDRPIAIAGLAMKMQLALGDDYVAGLWRSRLVTQLYWSVDEPRRAHPFGGLGRPRPLIAPTWSWTSTMLPVKMFTQNPACLDIDMAEVRDVQESHVAEDNWGDLAGRRRLRLYTIPWIARSGGVESYDNSVHFITFPMLEGPYETFGYAVLDEAIDPAEVDARPFVCAPLTYYDGPFVRMQGILLRETVENSGVYERVGSWSSKDRAGRAKAAKLWFQKLKSMTTDEKAKVYQELVIV